MSWKNTILFPRWRRNHSSAEFLDEMATLARSKPEQFERVVVLYMADNDSTLALKYASHNISTLQQFGALDLAAKELFEDTTKRR